jgi:hypothetical protein
MVFLRDDAVINMLKEYFFMDDFIEWSTPEILAEIKDHESTAIQREYERVYANARDKRLARKFREVIQKKGLADFDDQRLMWEYIRDRKAGFSGGPATWVKLNIQDDIVIGSGSNVWMFTDLDKQGRLWDGKNTMTFSSLMGQA